MRMLTLLLLGALVLAPSLAVAQPEDRQRAPTGAVSASPDPCVEEANDRMRAPSATWPGFDPRVPVPAGATSFTGIAPPGRDPFLGFPQPPQPGTMARACTQRLSR